MRILLQFLVCMNLVVLVSAQDNKAKRPEDGIRKYWFVMLMKGPNRNQDSTTAANIQREHLNNITKLYNEGKLKVAGPFGDSDKWLGIFIFDCPTKEEVEKLLKTDLAVSSGRLSFEIQAWYTAPTGSFTPEYRRINIEVPRIKNRRSKEGIQKITKFKKNNLFLLFGNFSTTKSLNIVLHDAIMLKLALPPGP